MSYTTPTQGYSDSVQQRWKEIRSLPVEDASLGRVDSYHQGGSTALPRLLLRHPLLLAQAAQDQPADQPADKPPDLRVPPPKPEEEGVLPLRPGDKKKEKKGQIPQTGIRFGPGEIVLFPREEAPPNYGVKTPWGEKKPLVIKLGGSRKPFQGEKLEESLRAQLELAQNHLNGGEFGRCREIVTKILKTRPRQEIAAGLLALSLVGEGHTAEAARVLQELSRFAPKSRFYLQARGVYELFLGRYEQAIPFLEAWVRARPNSLEPYVTLASAHLNMGQREKVLRAVEKFKPQDPRDEAVIGILHYVAGKEERGVQLLRNAAKIASEEPDILGNLSIALFTRDKLEEALKIADAALLLNPEQFQALLVRSWIRTIRQDPKDDRGVLISDLERLNKRLQQFRAASTRGTFSIVLGPGFDSSLDLGILPDERAIGLVLAVAYLWDQRFDKAEPLLEEARRRGWGEKGEAGPISRENLFNHLLRVKIALKKMDDAEEVYKAALQIWPDDARLLLKYIEFAATHKPSKPLETRYVEKLKELSVDSTDPDVFFALAQLHLFSQKPEEAERYIRRGEALSPNDPDFQSLWPLYYLMKGQPDRARRAAERAVKLGTKQPNPSLLLIGLAMRDGRHREVDRRMEEFARTFPDQEDSLLSIGDGYLRMAMESLDLQGFKSLTSPASEREWLKMAEKWLHYVQSRRQGSTTEVTWIQARLIRGTTEPTDVDLLAQHSRLHFLLPFVMACQGPSEPAEQRLSEALEAAEIVEVRMFGIAMFSGLIRAGAVPAAQRMFSILWDSPKVDRTWLVQKAQMILRNPYPRKARPFIGTLAIKLGDEAYTHDRLREARRFYRQALETDPTQEKAWVGLIQTLKVLGLKRRAARLEREYEKRFSSP